MSTTDQKPSEAIWCAPADVPSALRVLDMDGPLASAEPVADRVARIKRGIEAKLAPRAPRSTAATLRKSIP